MRVERKDSSGMVDYIPPYEKGEIISRPDGPQEDLEIINVGDAASVVLLLGVGVGGSTIIMPVGSQLRRTKESLDSEHAHLRAYLYTIQLDGAKRYEWIPEKDWVDPRG